MIIEYPIRESSAKRLSEVVNLLIKIASNHPDITYSSNAPIEVSERLIMGRNINITSGTQVQRSILSTTNSYGFMQTFIADTFTLDGILWSRYNGTSPRYGGGSFLIIANSVVGSGTIDVNGNDGDNAGGSASGLYHWWWGAWSSSILSPGGGQAPDGHSGREQALYDHIFKVLTAPLIPDVNNSTFNGVINIPNCTGGGGATGYYGNGSTVTAKGGSGGGGGWGRGGIYGDTISVSSTDKGGNGGGGGGLVIIIAKEIRGITITAVGGRGGNAIGNGGGGGGGGGGYILLVSGSDPQVTTNVSGGLGGNGINPGATGEDGRVDIVRL